MNVLDLSKLFVLGLVSSNGDLCGDCEDGVGVSVHGVVFEVNRLFVDDNLGGGGKLLISEYGSGFVNEWLGCGYEVICTGIDSG